MPSPLQKAPRGLLELFSLKTLGRAPFAFSDEVRPVVEIGDLYGIDLVEAGAAQTGGTATGGNATLTVPAGEVWLVDALSCDVTLVAGANFTTEYLSAVLSAQRGGGVSVHVQQKTWDVSVFATPIVIAETLSLGYFFPRPLVCLSGTILRADFLYQNSGTALDQFIQCRFARLR